MNLKKLILIQILLLLTYSLYATEPNPTIRIRSRDPESDKLYAIDLKYQVIKLLKPRKWWNFLKDWKKEELTQKQSIKLTEKTEKIKKELLSLIINIMKQLTVNETTPTEENIIKLGKQITNKLKAKSSQDLSELIKLTHALGAEKTLDVLSYGFLMLLNSKDKKIRNTAKITFEKLSPVVQNETVLSKIYNQKLNKLFETEKDIKAYRNNISNFISKYIKNLKKITNQEELKKRYNNSHNKLEKLYLRLIFYEKHKKEFDPKAPVKAMLESYNSEAFKGTKKAWKEAKERYIASPYKPAKLSEEERRLMLDIGVALLDPKGYKGKIFILRDAIRDEIFGKAITVSITPPQNIDENAVNALLYYFGTKIRKLITTTVIDLRKLNLNTFPEALFFSKSIAKTLGILNIANNPIKKIPYFIPMLPKIKIINLLKTDIKNLPSQLEQKKGMAILFKQKLL